MNLRTPSPTWERLKRAIALIGLFVGLEMADPLPFTENKGSWILYGLAVAEIIRQFILRRFEVNMSSVVRAQGYRDYWEAYRDRLDARSRYRFRRFIGFIMGWAALGALTDLFSDRCDGVLQCMFRMPFMLIEQIPSFLMIAITIMLSMVQILAVFFLMAKVGSFKVAQPGTIRETFDDVFGQDHARDAVMEQVALLDDSEAIEAAGGHMVKGILLYGPPGTGKTLLAKAAANMTAKPLIIVPVGGFASTFIGINFLKVGIFFRTIRKMGRRHGGCLVFFDEIDSLGNRGGDIEGFSEEEFPACFEVSEPDPVIVTGGGGGGMNMGTLESFLAGLDGMDEPRGLLNAFLSLIGLKPQPAPRSKFLLIGATNRKAAIDPALLRAGRIEEHIHVDYPDQAGKLATYAGYLHKVDADVTESEMDRLARMHHHGTGAEIEAIVNKSILKSFRDNIHPGTVTYEELMDSLIVKRLGQPEGHYTREERFRGVAVHEAGHAVAAHYLRREHYEIWLASIEKRGRTGGMVVPVPLDEDGDGFRDEVMAHIAIALASRAAEDLVLGRQSVGHAGDGRNATLRAETLLRVGGFPGQIGQFEAATKERYEQIETLLGEGLDLAYATLRDRTDQIEAVADLLQAELTVDGHQIHSLLDKMEAERNV